MLNNSSQTCHCGSGKSFSDCCEKFINASQYPESAEQLMRSRYSAYVLKNEDYLLKSWHQSTRPDSLALANDTTMPERAEQVKVMLNETRSGSIVQWKKLNIISSTVNSVTFVAYFSNNINDKERLFFLYEESDFVKDKHWFYVEGKNLKTTELSKNMLCPCQSGKKFKRCCDIYL